MKEIFKMWKYPNMVALAAFTSAIYVAALVPFKSTPLIPGFTEIRPANLLPVIFGLLFGPAGAWGSAIGNLVADFFGTLSPASVFGFAGNFFYAFIPYKIWGTLRISQTEPLTPTLDSPKKLVEFGLATITASSACALLVGWGADAMKLVPFAELATIIFLNNSVMTLVLGPAVLPGLYARFKKWGLLWTDILPSDYARKPKDAKLFSLFVIAGSVGGLIVGLVASFFFARQSVFSHGFTAAVVGNPVVSASILPFLVMLFFGATKL